MPHVSESEWETGVDLVSTHKDPNTWDDKWGDGRGPGTGIIPYGIINSVTQGDTTVPKMFMKTNQLSLSPAACI